MSVFFCRKFACVLLLLSLIISLSVSDSSAKEAVTSIHQLNSSEYTVAVSESGAAFIAVKRDLSGAKLIYAS